MRTILSKLFGDMKESCRKAMTLKLILLCYVVCAFFEVLRKVCLIG